MNESPTADQIRERYPDQFGVAAGYLPPRSDQVTGWIERQLSAARAAKARGQLLANPAAEALGHLIENDEFVAPCSDSCWRNPEDNKPTAAPSRAPPISSTR